MVAVLLSGAVSCAGDSDGCWLSRSAATPAACGAAMEVPDMVAVEIVEVDDADRTDTPGAYRSTQVPKFEKEVCSRVFGTGQNEAGPEAAR